MLSQATFLLAHIANNGPVRFIPAVYNIGPVPLSPSRPAFPLPRLTFSTITKQEIRMSSTCSVLPRDLVSVEVAAKQVGARPQTLLTRRTIPVL